MSDAHRKLQSILAEITLGEVRLGTRSDEQVYEHLEVAIWDEEGIPEADHPSLLKQAKAQLAAARKAYQQEALAWPPITDCDRLQRGVTALRDRGIVLWPASPCCDNCTMGELPDHVDQLEVSSPGLKDRLRGYAFFHDQQMPEMLAQDTNILVYVGYGWTLGGSDTPEQTYQQQAVAIGHEVAQALKDAELDVEWDGDFNQKIGLHLNWQLSKPLA